jgi:hypothetical protein
MSDVHAGSVTAIAALSNFSPTGASNDVADLILTAGSDCLVNVWLWDGLGQSGMPHMLCASPCQVDVLILTLLLGPLPATEAPRKIQTFETAHKIPLALALARFPGSDGTSSLAGNYVCADR